MIVLLAGAVAKVQTVDLGTSTLRAFADLATREQPFSFYRDALSPGLSAIGGTFAGAALAFWFENNQKQKAERKRMVDHILLIRDDLRKAQRLLVEMIVLIEGRMEAGPNPAQLTIRGLFQLPKTYLGGFDYVAALPLIGQAGVDHIRNVITFLFPKWDDETGQAQLAHQALTNANYTSDCIENVVKHLEKSLPEIAVTERPTKPNVPK